MKLEISKNEFGLNQRWVFKKINKTDKPIARLTKKEDTYY